MLRAAGWVAVTAVVGAVFLPLVGAPYSRGEAAYFAGLLQLGGQVVWRLLGRMEARREAGI